MEYFQKMSKKYQDLCGGNMIEYICVWCGNTIKGKGELKSHGICKECLAIYFPDEFRKMEEEKNSNTDKGENDHDN